MTTATDGFGTLFKNIASGDVSLPEGFFVDVLPTQSDRASILAAGNSSVNVALDAGQWYSITVEILIRNSTQAHFFLYRTQIEAYRDAGVAVLHLSPTPPIVEAPSGGFGFYTVTLGVSGNNVTVQINNGSANTVSFARYIGYSRKPLP